MNKWWIWAVLILTTIITSFYIVWTNPRSKFAILDLISPKNKPAEGLPSELDQNFDPSVNEPRFIVVGLGNSENSLQLEYVFPPHLAGQKIESTLICEKGIRAREQGQSKLNEISLSDAISKINPENMPILMIGLCEDSTCQNIIGRCDLLLN
ncbi:MAG: hypothetical protein HZB18_04420 [Chloroflexi bacterium]|nr:hypothetical protein [Chloroflexota bacterium]